jgi:hypothetical protein
MTSKATADFWKALERLPREIQHQARENSNSGSEIRFIRRFTSKNWHLDFDRQE